MMLTLTEEGVYDCFCVPHELAGMVGRIVVAGSRASAPTDWRDIPGSLPEAARAAFPAVAEIVEKGAVRRR